MQMIDYATLHKWLNRDKSMIHGDILANLDTLIKTAIMYDDASHTIRHLESRIENLMKSIQLLNEDLKETKVKSCKTWTCENRKV